MKLVPQFRITEYNANRMVLRHNPWMLSGSLWATGAVLLHGAVLKPELFPVPDARSLAGAVAIAAFFGAWWFGEVITITFDRPAGGVLVRAARLFKASNLEIPLKSVRSAHAQIEWFKGKRRNRLTLALDRKRFMPLEESYTNLDREPLAKLMNDWLHGPVPQQPESSPATGGED